MHAFRCQRNKVPKVIMRRLRLRKPAVRLLLGRMDDVWKFDRVLDEEDRNVVADEIPVAFFGIELYGESPDIARQVCGALVPSHSGESNKRRCLFARPLKQIRPCEIY